MAKRSKKKRAVVEANSAQAVLHGDWIWGVALFVAVLVVYLPVCWAGYIWDDDTVVTANPAVISPAGLRDIWTTSAADICPLTLTTFWFEHVLWGLRPLPYHIVTVLWHAAGAVVLWRVLKQLLIPGSWFGATLWALHPVQVESVAWVTEMKNTQSGFFYLLAILFFVRSLNQAGRKDYAFTLLFAALAMASKSSTVVLPLVLMLCAWWVERRWNFRRLVEIGPIFLMSIAAGVVSILRQHQGGAEDPHWLRSWPERLVTAGDAVWFYLGKLLWPHPLMMVYPRWSIDAAIWWEWLPLLAVALSLGVLWVKRNTGARAALFAAGYFLLVVWPALGLINITYSRFSFVADHFQYLADMGPLALIGAGLTRIAEQVIPGKSSFASWVVLLILGVVSWQRAWAYQSQQTLWTDTLAENPDCWAGYTNLGFSLFQEGRNDEAVVDFRKALQLDPENVEAHNDLGVVYAEQGQPDAATNEYETALRLEPDYAQAHNNLGNRLLARGQVDEAMAHFRRALEIDPRFAYAENNMGRGYVVQGRMDDAAAAFRKALDMFPDYAEAHYNLGLTFFQRGQLNQAIDEFREALRLRPDLKAVQDNLAKAEAAAQTNGSH